MQILETMLRRLVKISLAIIVVAVLFSSCENFLDVDPLPPKIPADEVFRTDATAISAVMGMYIDMYQSYSFAGGGDNSVSVLAGLSADELINSPSNNRIFLDFEENDIDPQNAYILNLWRSIFETLYNANALLEGVSKSKTLSIEVSKQVKGEALFVRAFCNFYLVNLFGEVPLVLTTDYRINSKLKRSSTTDVYDQVIQDLTQAESLLPIVYPEDERTRPNSAAASALLARVYLYKGDWARAEDKSTIVISSNLYDTATLNGIFYEKSPEAIWQMRGTGTDPIASEAVTFSVSSIIQRNSLANTLIADFEDNDIRKQAWTVSVINGSETLYRPLKYKRQNRGSALPVEFSMVIRLAEIYLIRAEARAMQDKRIASISDLDIIRKRARLPLVQNENPSISQEDLLLLIEHERKIELFGEWGHRWLDLKRLHHADDVLNYKDDWQSFDELYPIPSQEIRNNSNLAPQNSGY